MVANYRPHLSGASGGIAYRAGYENRVDIDPVTQGVGQPTVGLGILTRGPGQAKAPAPDGDARASRHSGSLLASASGGGESRLLTKVVGMAVDRAAFHLAVGRRNGTVSNTPVGDKPR